MHFFLNVKTCHKICGVQKHKIYEPTWLNILPLHVLNNSSKWENEFRDTKLEYDAF